MKRLITLIGVLTLGVSAFAQPNTAAGPDLTGMWLVQDPGSGSFEEWFDNVPKPALRPEIIKDNQALKASANAGNVVNRARRTAACPIGNLPLMMASSPALNIVQSRDEVLVGVEAARARFIYTDGRDHFDTKLPGYQPTGYGHSIGHWEGDTLVVDTVAFPATVCDTRHPVLVTPGGGRAKDTTHLLERYRLTNGGTMLSVTFTWEDPTVFLKPHTYFYVYKKLPDALPFENNDDLRDAGYRERQLKSVSTPEQK
jgi:hypothetical protein